MKGIGIESEAQIRSLLNSIDSPKVEVKQKREPGRGLLDVGSTVAHARRDRASRRAEESCTGTFRACKDHNLRFTRSSLRVDFTSARGATLRFRGSILHLEDSQSAERSIPVVAVSRIFRRRLNEARQMKERKAIGFNEVQRNRF